LQSREDRLFQSIEHIFFLFLLNKKTIARELAMVLPFVEQPG
jgi:hypothetical protein